jgi:hypothetical protein
VNSRGKDNILARTLEIDNAALVDFGNFEIANFTDNEIVVVRRLEVVDSLQPAEIGQVVESRSVNESFFASVALVDD